ncbi:MAG: heme lyase CcmF/NrfE family subunit [Chloroflexota bacterium]|nr:MAG: heme lyase CcmF/NrfE family subunit [Chloroflexota bacterium]
MTEIGYFSLVIALFVSGYSAVAYVYGARARVTPLLTSARNGVYVAFGLATIASAILVNAFFSRDFGVAYVYQYSSSDMDVFYTFAAWWAGQAGSLLFWAWLLSLFAVIVIYQNRDQNRELIPYVGAIMMVIMAFFMAVMAFSSNPFERLPVTPAEGEGLNPLLQNMGMFFHPTTLYLGYVGFTVPFAFALAALMTGRLGDQWIQSTRRWTLFAWFFLGMGNLFGAQWAYVELGWGGYMGWDPVENASMMPWFVGTAYLHSVMIQQRRGMLKVWNMVLIILTYALSIFGTLLTRSGILSSVHTFSESALGPMFMGLIAAIVVISLYFLLERLPQLRAENQLDSLLSRESSFLFNNLLLVGAAFAMFWGTVFPLISEAVRGVKITVGPPFYNQVIPPILLAMIVLMGICPLIGWRKASHENLVRNFLKPFVATVLLVALLVATGTRSPAAGMAYGALGFVGFTILLELYRGTRARRHVHGESIPLAFLRLVWSNKPRYGGYVVHIGVIIIGVGVAASSLFSTTVEGNLRPGESLAINQYNLTFERLQNYQTKARQVASASMAVTENGQPVGQMISEKYTHRGHETPVTEVSIRTTLLEDLYVILAGFAEDGSASFKILVNPMVIWIWIGGVVMLAGTMITMWPDPREARRRVTAQVRGPAEKVVTYA